MKPKRTLGASIAPTRGRGLRFVFICQAVDDQDPVHATTVRWITALARKADVEHVSVLALRKGRYAVPSNVDVHAFGRSAKAATLAAFYRGVIRSLGRHPDCFFIHQGGPYPALLLPLKLLLGRPIVQWKAHPAITPAMALYARWCDDLIFTSARAAFPMDSPKVRVVGQGVDTDTFRQIERPLAGDLVAACRIGRSKQVDRMVEVVIEANRIYGMRYRFDVYGPILPGDETYAARVRALIARSAASDLIRVHGPVAQSDLPGIFSGYRACLNFSVTAIDRSVVEAMACGLPVISTNDSIAEIVPGDLRPMLITPKSDVAAQAAAIHGLLQKPETERAELGRRMRALVVADHGVDRLFDRILEEVRELLCNQR